MLDNLFLEVAIWDAAVCTEFGRSKENQKLPAVCSGTTDQQCAAVQLLEATHIQRSE